MESKPMKGEIEVSIDFDSLPPQVMNRLSIANRIIMLHLPCAYIRVVITWPIGVFSSTCTNFPA